MTHPVEVGVWGGPPVDIATISLFVVLAAVVALAYLVPSFAPYRRRMPMVALLLGISSGFPFTLLLGTMTFWLSKVGIDKSTIGFAIGLTTPYTLKFLWAPLVDRLRIPVLGALLGQRRSWLVVVQVLLVLAIWQLGASNPSNDNLGPFAFWAIVVSFLSATQDIIIDAYRIEILPEDELSHGTAMNQFGYRIGNLFAGVGTIWLASSEGQNLGWALAYGITSLLVLPALLGSLIAGPGQFKADAVRGAGQSAGEWIDATLVSPFREFLKRRGAWMILFFVLVYKIGDAMGQGMLNPMLVELGFSDTEFITINKGVGVVALIVGSALGPAFIAWLGMGRALLLSGLMMMFSNLMFVVLAYAGRDTTLLALAVGTENFTSGIGLTVFVAYLSGLSNLAYTATQFALLSALAGVARTWLATPAGKLAEALGWPGFWMFTVAAAIPGMVLLWFLWRRGFVVETTKQVPGTVAPTPPPAKT